MFKENQYKSRSNVKVTKARHPNVSGDIDSYPVVPFLGSKHVVPDKHHLHPTLPFFSLIPAMTVSYNQS